MITDIILIFFAICYYLFSVFAFMALVPKEEEESSIVTFGKVILCTTIAPIAMPMFLGIKIGYSYKKDIQISLPSGLDKAAHEYAKQHRNSLGYISKEHIEGFKAGAEWMAAQDISHEGHIAEFSEDGMKYIESEVSEETIIKSLGLKVGDKVIVQIRKK